MGELPVQRPVAHKPRALECRLSRDYVRGVADGTGRAELTAKTLA